MYCVCVCVCVLFVCVFVYIFVFVFCACSECVPREVRVTPQRSLLGPRPSTRVSPSGGTLGSEPKPKNLSRSRVTKPPTIEKRITEATTNTQKQMLTV